MKRRQSMPTLAPAPIPAAITPLAPERYKVQLTVGPDTYAKLRHAQDLLRHSIPRGDVAQIFDRALTLLIADVERTKFAASDRPRAARPVAAGSRHIPAAVRRAVWQRDGGRCAFVGTKGRCSERGFLEFHHVTPFADGGKSIETNLELRCRAHNAHEAEKYFGTLWVREARMIFGTIDKLGPDLVAPGGAGMIFEPRELLRQHRGT